MGICCRNNSAVVQTDKGKATETYAKFFVDPSSSDENTAKSRSDSEKEETSSEENSSEHPSTDAASATTRSTIHSLPMVEENGTDPQRSLTSKGGSGLKKTVSVTKGGSFADFFMNSSGLSKNSSFGEASALSMFNEFTKSPKSALPSVDEKSSDSSDDDIEEVSAKISITTESLKSSDDSRDGNSLKSVPTARSTGSKSLPSLRMRSLREKKLSDERHDENGGLIQTKSKSDEKIMSSMSQDENGSHITTKSKSDDEKSVKFMSQDESLHQTKSKSDEKSAQSTGSQKLQDEKNNEEQSVNSDLKSLSWVSKFKVGSNNQMAVRPQDDSINNQMMSTDGKTVDRDMALDDQAIATNYFGCCGI